MQRRIYLVGCQRSGTTLLRLILESHPDFFCYDELLGYQVLASSGASDSDGSSHNRVLFKIPRWCEQLLDEVLWDEGLPYEASNFYRGEKIIFLVRDPRAVVGSMRKLTAGPKIWLETFPKAIMGAKLHRNEKFRSEYGAEYEQAIHSRHPSVSLGALYWKYKSAAYFQYAEQGLPIILIRYEFLVTRPEETLRALCEFLGTPWQEELLHHQSLEHAELFPDGYTLGGTDPRLPIHDRSVGEWPSLLSETEIEEIERVTAELQTKFSIVEGLDTRSSDFYLTDGAGR